MSKPPPQPALIFISAALFVDGIGAGIVMSVFPGLLIELTGNNVARAAVDGGWLTASYWIAQCFAAPVLGNLSDCYGRRLILLGSLAAFGINCLMLAIAPSIQWLFLGVTLGGAFTATFSAASAYVADVTLPEDRARKLALVIAASSAGVLLGPLLVGALEHYGTRAPFFVAASLALINVTFGIVFLPESLRLENRRSFSLAGANVFAALAKLRAGMPMSRLLGALALLQIAQLTVPVVWGYLTALKFGWSAADIGRSLSLSAAATILIQSTISGLISRRLGNLLTASISSTCLMGGLLGYAFASHGWQMLAAILPAALGSMTAPSLISHMSSSAGADRQGELQGVISGVTSVGMVFTPLLMTQLFSQFSAPDAPIYFPGAPYLFAALFACSGLALTLSSLCIPRQYC